MRPGTLWPGTDAKEARRIFNKVKDAPPQSAARQARLGDADPANEQGPGQIINLYPLPPGVSAVQNARHSLEGILSKESALLALSEGTVGIIVGLSARS